MWEETCAGTVLTGELQPERLQSISRFPELSCCEAAALTTAHIEFFILFYFFNLWLCHFFPPVLCVCLASSSCSTSRCGSWTCWSGSSPAWFCTSYTLCCALSAGTTHCLWALFSSATTMSSSNYSETASCWAKPIPTLCPPTVWGSSHSKDYTARPLLQTLDVEARQMEAWWMWKALGD